MIRITETLHYCAWCGELLIGEWMKDAKGREIHEGCIDDALDVAFSARPASIPPDVPETPQPDALTLWGDPQPFTAADPEETGSEERDAEGVPADPEPPAVEAAPMKTCTKCGKAKPATSEFSFSAKPGRLMGQCKDCKRLYYASWEQRKKAARAVPPPALPDPEETDGADPEAVTEPVELTKLNAKRRGMDPEPNPPVSAPVRGVPPTDAPAPSPGEPSVPPAEPLTPKTCRTRRMALLMSADDLDFRASLDTGTTASFEGGIYPDPETVRRIEVALRTQETKGETWPDSKRRSRLGGEENPSMVKARTLTEFAY